MFWGVLFTFAGFAVGWAASRALARAHVPAPVPGWWCAAVTAALWCTVSVLERSGVVPGWWLPVPLAATAFAAPLAVADVRYRRLPDVLTLPAYGLAVCAVVIVALGPGPPGPMPAIAGGGVTLAVHLLVHRLAPGSLGGGDVKLAGSLGMLSAAAGWPTLVVSMVLASVLTILLAGVLALAGMRRRCRRSRRSGGVPHGPGLLTATCVGVLFPAGLPAVGVGS